jgi:hypothetical protein
MSPREDAWAKIGLLLGLLQHTEHAINRVSLVVFTEQPVALEQIAFFERSREGDAWSAAQFVAVGPSPRG